MSSMTLRLTTTLLLVVVAMSGCAGEEDVPEDQVLRPASAPSGWTTTDLGPVSVATPAEWEKQPPAEPTQTMTTTTWRAKEADGTSPAGLEVRVITKPQQDARKAALALAGSAMASLGGGDVEPEKIVWPNAELAYLLAYTAKVPVETDPAAPKKSYIARTSVFDLADGGQIQVTALVDEAQGAKEPEQVLSTVKLAEG